MDLFPFKIFLRNTVALLVNKVSLSLIFLLMDTLVARRLGSEQLGRFSLVMSVLFIFQLISTLGYDNIIIRDVAKDHSRSGRLMHNGFILGLCSTLVCALVMFIISKVCHYPSFILKSFYFSILTLFLLFLNAISEALLIGLKKPQFVLYVASFRETLWLLLSFYFLGFFKNIDCVIAAFFISRAIGIVSFIVLFNKKNIAFFERGYFPQWKDLFSQITTFLFITILSNLMFEIDIIILYRFAPAADVGIYSIAKKLFKMGFIVLYSMVMALFPVISEVLIKGKESVISHFKLFTKQTLIAGSVIIAGVLIISPLFVGIFFGQAYTRSVNVIDISIWKTIPLGLSFLWSRFLIAAHKQNQDLYALIIGFSIYIFICILMVKAYGYIGLAVGDLIGISILAVLHLFFVDRYVFKQSLDFLKV